MVDPFTLIVLANRLDCNIVKSIDNKSAARSHSLSESPEILQLPSLLSSNEMLPKCRIPANIL